MGLLSPLNLMRREMGMLRRAIRDNRWELKMLVSDKRGYHEDLLKFMSHGVGTEAAIDFSRHQMESTTAEIAECTRFNYETLQKLRKLEKEVWLLVAKLPIWQPDYENNLYKWTPPDRKPT